MSEDQFLHILICPTIQFSLLIVSIHSSQPVPKADFTQMPAIPWCYQIHFSLKTC